MDLIKFFFIMIFLAFGFVGLDALNQDSRSLDSLDDIGLYALENSTSYRRVLLDVLTARNQLEGFIRLDESSLSLSSSANESSLDNTAALALPLIDQLSLNASVNSDNSGLLGFSFSPLTHSDSRAQLKINYDKAVLLAEETAVTTENQALAAALDWMSAARQLEIQSEIVQVKETVYRDEKIRYEAGEATLDDVRDALTDWTEARTTLSAKQTVLRSAESDLVSRLGADLDTSDIRFITAETLLEELDKLKSTLSPEQADPSKVYTVAAAWQNVKSSQKSLYATWLLEPELNLTGSIRFPDYTDSSAGITWEGGVQLVLSLDDWQGKEKYLSRQELELTTLEAGQADRESRLKLQQVMIAMDNTEQNRILAGLERDQSQDLFEEAQFLYKAGDYSRAEMDDARLLYELSRVNFFSMAAAEYLAWRELLPYL